MSGTFPEHGAPRPKEKPMNTLIIAAHPDDEVLGCGGTMARLAQAGNAVSVLILGEGATSRDNAPPHAAHDLTLACQKACATLGVRDIALAGMPDNRFDTIPLLDIAKRIEAEIERVNPVHLYTHHGGDLNTDHAIAFRAALIAARPAPGNTLREMRTFEIPSSTEWAFGRFAPPFNPNVFVDISATLDLKLAAMTLYKSETRPAPHPRSPQALQAAAQQRGSTAGFTAAEAFEIVWRLE